MEKRWVLKPDGAKETASHLAENLKISPILLKMLTQRGINTYEEAKDFSR